METGHLEGLGVSELQDYRVYPVAVLPSANTQGGRAAFLTTTALGAGADTDGQRFWGLDGESQVWFRVPRVDRRETVTQKWHFNTGAAPFDVTGTTKVTNLNADLLDNLDTATAATGSTIVARESDGRVKCADPVDPTDGTNLRWIRAELRNADDKKSVKCGSIAALADAYTLSANEIEKTTNGAFPNQDGVVVNAGDYFALLYEGGGGNNYYLGSQNAVNGIWKLTVKGDASTKWKAQRAENFDVTSEITAGAYFFVDQGTQLKNSKWALFTDDPVTVKTNAPKGVSAVLAAGGSLVSGTTYFYKVAFVDFSGGEAATDTEVSATPSAGNLTINLSWTSYAEAISYRVYRTTSAGSYGGTSLAGVTTGTSFSDTGVSLSSGSPLTASALEFGKIASNSFYQQGNGINISGDVISVRVNASTTYTANAVIYHGSTSTISSLAVNATATNKFLRQVSSGAPSWEEVVTAVTATLPITSSGGQTPNISTSMATGSLIGRNTAGTGVMEVITDIPTAVTIGTAYIYRIGGTDVAVTDGGTGVGTFTAGLVVSPGGTTALTTVTGTAGTIVKWGTNTLVNSIIVETASLLTIAGSITLTGAQTIQTSTGNLTIATAAGNGNVAVNMHGTGDFIVASTLIYADQSAASVGINTSTPGATFDVEAAGGATLRVGRTGQAYIQFDSDGTDGTILSSASAAIKVKTGGDNLRFTFSASASTLTGQGATLLTNSSSILTVTGTGGLTLSTASNTNAILNFGSGTTTITTSAASLSYLTAKSILFAGASGAITQDNANFQYDSTAKTLSLGTAVGINTQFMLGGSYSFSGTARAIEVTTSMTLAAGTDGYGILSTPTFVEAASGIHALLTNLYLGAPTVTGGVATVTKTAVLYIAGPMTATVTETNWAAYIVSGNVYLGSGNTSIGTTTTTWKLTVNDSTAQAQATFYGYTVSGAAAGVTHGSIQIGNTVADAGRIDYSSSGNTTFYIENTFDNASAVMKFRMRTAGTPVDALTILGSGNVGIGTTAPGSLLHVVSGANGVNTSNLGIATVVAPANDANGVLQVASNNAQAINMGGSLTFAGRVTDSSAANSVLAAIRGYKSSSTSGNGNSYMSFSVLQDGVGLDEKVRILSTGNVGIGTAGPTATLDLAAAARSGASGLDKGWFQSRAQTYTDNATAASGTATQFAFHSIFRPTLAATNTSVTTTDAATLYITNSPANGTNMTIANPWSIWVDDGHVRLDGNLKVFGTTTLSGATVTVLAAVGANSLVYTDVSGNLSGLSSVRGSVTVGGVANWTTLAIGTVGKILRSDGTDLIYSTATYPTTVVANRLIWASGTNVITDLSTTSDRVMVSTGGVPTWTLTMPAGLLSSDLNPVQKAKYFNVGDGALTTITLTHNFATTDVIVQVWKNSGNFDTVIPTFVRRTSNTVVLVFVTAPASNAYRAAVLASA